MTTVLPALSDLDVADDLVAEVEAWLRDPARTAHRLVTLPTAALVEQALAGQPTAPAAASAALPGGVWRVLPDRLLALHRVRRTDRLDRARITPAQHLQLTAMVLESWGWAQTDRPARRRVRTTSGRRCILGAQRALVALGYGTDVTAVEAGRRLDGTLAARGITARYWDWNEFPGTTGPMVLALVRDAARGS